MCSHEKGYPSQMVELILNCISTISYQILVNGQPSIFFKPERGLPQGDPLSLYLFIIYSDVLSGLLVKASAENPIHGIQVARRAPKISHLLFADHSLLFSRANREEANQLIKILDTHQHATGQVVNLDKLETSFSQNMLFDEKNMISNLMGVKTVETHSRYLGFPISFGRSKKVIFKFVSERVWKKLKGWKGKCLSRAGKEILIKVLPNPFPITS